jgi:hypothetical protein
MRSNGTLSYILSDHLGSTSLTTDTSGAVTSELRYTAWGEVRYQAGVTPTNYTYTGQYDNTVDFGLMYYNARWYDPPTGDFCQGIYGEVIVLFPRPTINSTMPTVTLSDT